MPTSSREPIGRRGPDRLALSRASIVDAALRVLRSEGLTHVTMRRVAHELDTGASSLYVYVAGTAELHATVLDALLGELDLAVVDDREEDWAERLAGLLTAYTRLLFAHPGLARAALVWRPQGANYLRLVETVLGLLHQGGASDAQAAWGVDLLILVATAQAAEHASRADEGAEESYVDDLRETLAGATPATHPWIAAAFEHLFSGSPTERMSWMVRAVATGIAATPR